MPERKRPWVITQAQDGCYILTDATGIRLAHFYYIENASAELGYLTKAEALSTAQTIQRMSVQ